MLNDVPKDDEVSSLDFYGSTLVMAAESKTQVLDMLKNDPYSKADVWDWEKVRPNLLSLSDIDFVVASLGKG